MRQARHVNKPIEFVLYVYRLIECSFRKKNVRSSFTVTAIKQAKKHVKKQQVETCNTNNNNNNNKNFRDEKCIGNVSFWRAEIEIY